MCNLGNPSDLVNAIQDWRICCFVCILVKWKCQRLFKVEVWLPLVMKQVSSLHLVFEGPNAYGLLKSEMGVHCLIRIFAIWLCQTSPFTSFTSVEVRVDDTIEETREDIIAAWHRLCGARQTSIRFQQVRLTLLPYGNCRPINGRSYPVWNRDRAMKMLQAKLYQMEQEKKAAEVDSLAEKKNHVSQPFMFSRLYYGKDHRTLLKLLR